SRPDTHRYTQENSAVIQPAIKQSRFIGETSLAEVLASVQRNAGWIMAGGSAQFRSGALSELQSGLGQLHQHPVNQRVANAAKVLGEKAVLVAARNVNDAE